MKQLTLFVIGFILLGIGAHGQKKYTDHFLERLLREHASPQLLHILDNPDSFRVQLIYTKIDHAGRGWTFDDYFYQYDPLNYFNPASTVKLPIALLALEKIHALERYGIDKYSPMLTDSSYSGQHPYYTDSTAASGLPSVAQYVKRIFLISDNDAYNRLYEFVGQDYIHERLWKMGYTNVRIPRRFMPLSEDENRHTNPIRFLGKDGKLAYTQPAAVSMVQFDFSRPVFIGKGHWDAHDSLLPTPMDFTRHNNIPLRDLSSMLRAVLFPDLTPASRRWHITSDDYAFLLRYMSEYPSESTHPKYDTAEYFDSYTKFFFFKAGRGAIPPYIRSFNKPGWSYGFLTDVAYIVDFKNNVDFMLSGTIYVNRDGILNDDKYEYDELGYPFFKEVGEIIYQYELGRARRGRSEPGRFRIDYSSLSEH